MSLSMSLKFSGLYTLGLLSSFRMVLMYAVLQIMTALLLTLSISVKTKFRFRRLI